MKVNKLIKNLLIYFALISIGFAFGKNSLNRNISKNTQFVLNSNKNYVAVFYMHSTFRCASCNKIEKMTQVLLEQNYSDELQNGQIKWKDIDFQENINLAKKFKVIASCVVVSTVKNGEYFDIKRLDDVWTLMNNPIEFDLYLSKAININFKKLKE